MLLNVRNEPHWNCGPTACRELFLAQGKWCRSDAKARRAVPSGLAFVGPERGNVPVDGSNARRAALKVRSAVTVSECFASIGSRPCIPSLYVVRAFRTVGLGI